MSSREAVAPERKRISWVPFAIIAAIAVIFLASQGGGGATVNDRYLQLNSDAAKTAGTALGKWEQHEPLTDQDRADLGHAVIDFDKMLELRPQAWNGHHGAASVFAALDQWDRAIPHLKFVIEHAPSQPNADEKAILGHAYYLNSLALFFSNKPAEAEKEADAAVAIEKSTDYLYARAQARAQVHKLEGAEDDLRQALELSPGNERCLSLLKFISNMK